jgi:oxalate decarboxylase
MSTSIPVTRSGNMKQEKKRGGFSLNSIESRDSHPWGSIKSVTSDTLPTLDNISFSQLILKKGALLKPIWHPNAHKIGYCTSGTCLVTARGPGKTSEYTVAKGEIFFIPKGFAHQLHNYADAECIVNFALSHHLPDIMTLEGSVDSIPDTVFNATFGTSPGFVASLKNADSAKRIVSQTTGKDIATGAEETHKFDIEKSEKVVAVQGGYLQLGIKKVFPILEELGILGIGLTPGGIVEPHWHTNAGELIFVVRGKARISVLSPDGVTETFEASEGEGAFAPASYFHHIENIGDGESEIIAFFSSAEPNYIGIGEVMGALTNEGLGAIFNTTPDHFKNLEKPQGPKVIVP